MILLIQIWPGKLKRKESLLRTKDSWLIQGFSSHGMFFYQKHSEDHIDSLREEGFTGIRKILENKSCASNNLLLFLLSSYRTHTCWSHTYCTVHSQRPSWNIILKRERLCIMFSSMAVMAMIRTCCLKYWFAWKFYTGTSLKLLS